MRQVMLTTIDNPFDPFTQYSDWYAYDEASGHQSTSLLARITLISDELSEPDQAAELERAIDEIVHYNVSGLHRKVVRETE